MVEDVFVPVPSAPLRPPLCSSVPPVSHTLARLEAARYSWVWVVLQCPYCGGMHDHYGGAFDGDPAWYLRHPRSTASWWSGGVRWVLVLVTTCGHTQQRRARAARYAGGQVEDAA